MTRATRLVIFCALTAYGVHPTAAQTPLRDARTPEVTAEGESWYLSGAPVTFAGRLYYPAGPRVHFLPSEMVRSGDVNGVPLFTRTTIEPYSLIFVPVGGGMMQPYERRRDGELAGTVGSAAPSFPVARSGSAPEGLEGPQAPAPPMLAAGAASQADVAGRPVGTSGTVGLTASPADAGPGVPGRIAESSRRAGTAPPLARPRPRPAARRTNAPNAIFIDYAGSRWFSNGSPVPFDPARFERIGAVRGFPVYRDRSAPDAALYVAVVRDEAAGLLAPYARRPQ